MDNFFTGTIKVTPMKFKNDSKELLNVGKNLSKFLYQINEYPSEGFFPYVTDEEYNNQLITIKELKNNLTVLPFRIRYDKIDANKRKGLSQSEWERMPLNWRYQTRDSDILLIENVKKIALISQKWHGELNYLKKHFFEHHVFSENRWSFNPTSKYQITSDMFKWLCYKFLKKEGNLNGFEITDIAKIIEIIEKTSDEATYKGDGILNTWNEIKLSITNKRTFYEMKIGIYYNNNEYEFQINRDGQIVLYLLSCSNYRKMTRKERVIHLLSDIYINILPEILSLYSSDEDWIKKDRYEFEKWCNDEIKNKLT